MSSIIAWEPVQPSTDLIPAFKTESCFTSEGVQWAIDSTSLKMMRECWYKYHIAIRLGLRTTEEAAPLTFGRLLHIGQEVYYKQRVGGTDHRLSLHKACRAVLAQTWNGHTSMWWSQDRKRNTLTLLRTLICRMDELQDDAQFTLILNGEPAVEITFQFELDRLAAHERPYVLCGRLDRVVQHGSRIWPTDLKHTTSAIKNPDKSLIQDRFGMDSQMTIYTLGGQVVFHQPVSGVLVDLNIVSIGDSKGIRGPVTRPEEYLEEWLGELNYTLDELELNVAKNVWPHRDTSCFLCAFKNICPKAPSVRHNYLGDGSFYQHKWNPLATREA